jgi:hypothetical protein
MQTAILLLLLSTISSPQKVGVAFSITITAQDQFDNTVTSYTGSNTLGDLAGTINTTSTGAFTNGVWNGSVTIAKSATSVTISTSGSGKLGTSNQFDASPNLQIDGHISGSDNKAQLTMVLLQPRQNSTIIKESHSNHTTLVSNTPNQPTPIILPK